MLPLLLGSMKVKIRDIYILSPVNYFYLFSSMHRSIINIRF